MLSDRRNGRWHALRPSLPRGRPSSLGRKAEDGASARRLGAPVLRCQKSLNATLSKKADALGFCRRAGGGTTHRCCDRADHRALCLSHRRRRHSVAIGIDFADRENEPARHPGVERRITASRRSPRIEAGPIPDACSTRVEFGVLDSAMPVDADPTPATAGDAWRTLLATDHGRESTRNLRCLRREQVVATLFNLLRAVPSAVES